MEQRPFVDRNQLIGFALIGAILLGTSYWASTMEPAPQPEQSAEVESAAAPKAESALGDTLNAAQDTAAAEQEFVLENKDVRYVISNLGGQIKYVELKQYRDWQGKPLRLVDQNQVLEGLPAAAMVATQTGSSLTLRSDVGTTWSYELPAEGYGLKWALQTPSTGDLSLTWKQAGIRHEKSLKNEATNTSIYYFENAEAERSSLSDGSDDDESAENVGWVAHKQQYFSSILQADQGFTQVALSTRTPDDTLHSRLFSSELTLKATNGVAQASGIWYHGPNHYQTLKTFDRSFDEVIPFGWGIFGWIGKYIVSPLFNWLDGYGMNYGIIILLMAALIKLALSPLTFSSYKSMAKMRVLKPEMDELNEKFKDADPTKKQQETMALYQKAGVNPLGGCIPQLLSLPILIAMFRFFPVSIELRQQAFLWADDLSSYDSILSLPFEIPFYGAHVSLFTLLMAISTFLYTKFNNSMTPTSGNSMMQQQMLIIQYVMPFMLLVWFNNYSSGLSYYYFISNVLTFGQQWVIKEFFIDENAIRAKIDETKAKGGSQSRFAKKMNEMLEANKEAGNRRARRSK
ncbi:MAG: membrane protein insertase YidC [Bacteroidota bacterium]|jgi:YidC/Oxa1 family membrane protein insertase